MTGTDALVAAALLGVVRKPLDASTLTGDLGAVAGGLTGDPAENLLRAAALDAAYRDGGLRPVTAVLLEPTGTDDADDVPEVGPAAAARLAGMLTGVDRPLLPEWLRAVAHHGRRVPAQQLPTLLDLAARDPALRPDVTTAVGARGRWLAGLDPRWRHSLSASPGPRVDPSTDTTWTHGDHGARLAWLTACRAVDPGRARETLAGSWSSETVEHRVAFLGALATTLGPDDEGFLESALDDRSAAVADAAAQLLTSLPTSALGRAVTAWVTGVLVVHRGLRGARLELHTDPPTEPRLRMVLQLLGDQQVGGDVGRVLGAVARTPLPEWTRRTGLSPEQLVGAALDDAARAVLHRAWADAALRQRDQAWARALGPTHPQLVALLPPADRDAVLDEVLRRGTPQQVLAAVTAVAPQGLSDRTTRAWVDRVVADPTVMTWLAPTTREVHTHGAVSAAPYVETAQQALAETDPRRRTLRRTAQVLTDRREMLEEIR